MCLTGHYTDEHFKFKSSVLAFRRFLDSHTKRRVHRFISDEIKKMNTKDKLRGIMTDNGPDM